ncbi:MAG: ABC transporter permease [Polyangiaceae bacterium]|jgi:simple sugar transport system permease protein
MSGLFSAAFVAASLRMTVPLGFAAMGGVLSERAGVPNIALEGTMLGAAFGAVAIHEATGSPVAGLVGGALTGALFGVVHAMLVVRARVDAIVSGLALNLIAVGGTRSLLRAFYHSSANSPNVLGFSYFDTRSPVLRVILDPMTWVFVAATLATVWLVGRSWLGLWIRASGDDPRSAHAAAVPVGRVRFGAVVLGCLLAGLGGVALAFEQRQFQSGMTGGRGFIALAAVIVAGWRPGRAVLACAVFATLDAAGFVLQDRGGALPQLFAALPYVGTLLVLVFVGTRGRAAPRGLGQHHDDGDV